jgi:hypothetical protein
MVAQPEESILRIDSTSLLEKRIVIELLLQLLACYCCWAPSFFSSFSSPPEEELAGALNPGDRKS